MAEVQFFGSVDRNKHTGKVQSSMPGWYFQNQIFDLNDRIESLDRRLNDPESQAPVTPEARPAAMKELREMKERRDKILEGKPKLNAKQRDDLMKIYDTLGERISESMYSRSDMQRGLADAHEEARRQKMACIDPGDIGDIMDQFNVTPIQGKISRDNAVRMWKVLGRALGRGTNYEALRRD